EESVRAINDDYNQKLLQLDRQRLERLTRLAASQKPAEAAHTYEQLFRIAMAANLFADAEAAADTVVKAGSPAPTTRALAALVQVIARADRGAFEESLDLLRQAVTRRQQERQAGVSVPALTPDEINAICDAYYQRLVHEGQFAVVLK